MLDDGDKLAIIDRYSRRHVKYGDSIEALNPGDPARYRTQHAIHCSVGDSTDRVVLDVGCGLGHYYDYLRIRGIRARYVGYDIVPAFIDSNTRRFPEASFALRDIFVDGIDCTPDYVVFCQVFNNRYATASNVDVVKDALRIAFASATTAVSIDMLSTYVNYRETHLYYFCPEEMFAFGRTLTPFVSIRHDYAPRHFTLILRKEGVAS